MLIVIAAFLVVLGIGVAIWLRRLRPQEPVRMENWTAGIGDEFAELSDSERCDLIFAVAALENVDARKLLVGALDDPSEAVSLAAAHALVRQGGGAALEPHLGTLSAERARALRLLIEVLH